MVFSELSPGSGLLSPLIMRTFFTLAAGLLAACSTAFAAPQSKGDGYIGKYVASNHSTSTKEYIITFMRNETITKNMQDYLDMLKLEGDVVKFESTNNYTKVYIWDICDEHAQILNGLPEVSTVEAKVAVKTFVDQYPNSTWGLQRLSNNDGAAGSPTAINYTYSFNDSSLGSGVDIYIVDTGVRTSHISFTGRATQGFAINNTFTDGDGHGTHVAGTAAGAKWGVAQGANIIEVKVLGDDGSGSTSDTIQGMDWVISNHQKRKTQPGFVGSIMSMSWGLQGVANAVDEVIIGASQAGIHVSVAAGNDHTDACTSTPAHLGGVGSQSNPDSHVVTVGSVNINNVLSTFSNYGNCVDIYAPGEQVISAWNTGDNVINTLSGTSMATPHVSGTMAYLMAQDAATYGQNPQALKAKLLQIARQGQITGNLQGSANLLLSNGVDGGVNKRYVVVSDGGSPAARAAAVMAEDNLGMSNEWELVSRDATVRY